MGKLFEFEFKFEFISPCNDLAGRILSVKTLILTYRRQRSPAARGGAVRTTIGFFLVLS